MEELKSPSKKPEDGSQQKWKVWCGKIFIKGCFACNAEVFSDLQLQKLTKNQIDVHWKLKLEQAERRYLQQVPVLSGSREVQHNNWYCYLCQLKPVHNVQNFEKLVKYLKIKTAVSVVDMKESMLLLMCDNPLTTRMKIPTLTDSSTLHCILLSRLSRLQPDEKGDHDKNIGGTFTSSTTSTPIAAVPRPTGAFSTSTPLDTTTRQHTKSGHQVKQELDTCASKPLSARALQPCYSPISQASDSDVAIEPNQESCSRTNTGVIIMKNALTACTGKVEYSCKPVFNVKKETGSSLETPIAQQAPIKQEPETPYKHKEHNVMTDIQSSDTEHIFRPPEKKRHKSDTSHCQSAGQSSTEHGSLRKRHKTTNSGDRNADLTTQGTASFISASPVQDALSTNTAVQPSETSTNAWLKIGFTSPQTSALAYKQEMKKSAKIPIFTSPSATDDSDDETVIIYDSTVVIEKLKKSVIHKYMKEKDSSKERTSKSKSEKDERNSHEVTNKSVCIIAENSQNTETKSSLSTESCKLAESDSPHSKNTLSLMSNEDSLSGKCELSKKIKTKESLESKESNSGTAKESPNTKTNKGSKDRSQSLDSERHLSKPKEVSKSLTTGSNKTKEDSQSKARESGKLYKERSKSSDSERNVFKHSPQPTPIKTKSSQSKTSKRSKSKDSSQLKASEVTKSKESSRSKTSETTQLKESSRPKTSETNQSKETSRPKTSETTQSKESSRPKASETTQSKESSRPKASETTESKESSRPKSSETTQSKESSRPKASETTQSKESSRPKSSGTTQSKESIRPKASETTQSKESFRPKSSETTQSKESSRPKASETTQLKESSRPKTSETTQSKESSWPKTSETTQSKESSRPKASETTQSKESSRPKASETTQSKESSRPKSSETTQSKESSRPKASETTKSKGRSESSESKSTESSLLKASESKSRDRSTGRERNPVTASSKSKESSEAKTCESSKLKARSQSTDSRRNSGKAKESSQLKESKKSGKHKDSSSSMSKEMSHKEGQSSTKESKENKSRKLNESSVDMESFKHSISVKKSKDDIKSTGDVLSTVLSSLYSDRMINMGRIPKKSRLGAPKLPAGDQKPSDIADQSNKESNSQSKNEKKDISSEGKVSQAKETGSLDTRSSSGSLVGGAEVSKKQKQKLKHKDQNANNKTDSKTDADTRDKKSESTIEDQRKEPGSKGVDKHAGNKHKKSKKKAKDKEKQLSRKENLASVSERGESIEILEAASALIDRNLMVKEALSLDVCDNEKMVTSSCVTNAVFSSVFSDKSNNDIPGLGDIETYQDKLAALESFKVKGLRKRQVTKLKTSMSVVVKCLPNNLGCGPCKDVRRAVLGALFGLGAKIPMSSDCRAMYSTVLCIHARDDAEYTRSILYNKGLLKISFSVQNGKQLGKKGIEDGVLGTENMHDGKNGVDNVSCRLDSIVQGETSALWKFEKAGNPSFNETVEKDIKEQNAEKAGPDVRLIIPEASSHLDQSWSSSDSGGNSFFEMGQMSEAMVTPEARTAEPAVIDNSLPPMVLDSPKARAEKLQEKSKTVSAVLPAESIESKKKGSIEQLESKVTSALAKKTPELTDGAIDKKSKISNKTGKLDDKPIVKDSEPAVMYSLQSLPKIPKISDKAKETLKKVLTSIDKKSDPDKTVEKDMSRLSTERDRSQRHSGEELGTRRSQSRESELESERKSRSKDRVRHLSSSEGLDEKTRSRSRNRVRHLSSCEQGRSSSQERSKQVEKPRSRTSNDSGKSAERKSEASLSRDCGNKFDKRELHSDGRKHEKHAAPISDLPEKSSRNEKRRERQFHPYKKETVVKKPGVPSWSFDLAYDDMHELLQNLTENQYRAMKRQPVTYDGPRPQKSYYNRNSYEGIERCRKGRFCNFRFRRSDIPHTLPQEDTQSPAFEEQDNAVISPEAIPDLKDRQKRADMLEEIFMKPICDEQEYTSEMIAYVDDTQDDTDAKVTSSKTRTVTKLDAADMNNRDKSRKDFPDMKPGKTKEKSLNNDIDKNVKDGNDKQQPLTRGGKLSHDKTKGQGHISQGEDERQGHRGQSKYKSEEHKSQGKEKSEEPKKSTDNGSNNVKKMAVKPLKDCKETRSKRQEILSSESDVVLDWVDEEAVLDNEHQETRDDSHIDEYVVLDTVGDSDSVIVPRGAGKLQSTKSDQKLSTHSGTKKSSCEVSKFGEKAVNNVTVKPGSAAVNNKPDYKDTITEGNKLSQNNNKHIGNNAVDDSRDNSGLQKPDNSFETTDVNNNSEETEVVEHDGREPEVNKGDSALTTEAIAQKGAHASNKETINRMAVGKFLLKLKSGLFTNEADVDERSKVISDTNSHNETKDIGIVSNIKDKQCKHYGALKSITDYGPVSESEDDMSALEKSQELASNVMPIMEKSQELDNDSMAILKKSQELGDVDIPIVKKSLELDDNDIHALEKSLELVYGGECVTTKEHVAGNTEKDNVTLETGCLSQQSISSSFAASCTESDSCTVASEVVEQKAKSVTQKQSTTAENIPAVCVQQSLTRATPSPDVHNENTTGTVVSRPCPPPVVASTLTSSKPDTHDDDTGSTWAYGASDIEENEEKHYSDHVEKSEYLKSKEVMVENDSDKEKVFVIDDSLIACKDEFNTEMGKGIQNELGHKDVNGNNKAVKARKNKTRQETKTATKVSKTSKKAVSKKKVKVHGNKTNIGDIQTNKEVKTHAGSKVATETKSLRETISQVEANNNNENNKNNNDVKIVIENIATTASISHQPYVAGSSNVETVLLVPPDPGLSGFGSPRYSSMAGRPPQTLSPRMAVASPRQVYNASLEQHNFNYSINYYHSPMNANFMPPHASPMWQHPYSSPYHPPHPPPHYLQGGPVYLHGMMQPPVLDPQVQSWYNNTSVYSQWFTNRLLPSPQPSPPGTVIPPWLMSTDNFTPNVTQYDSYFVTSSVELDQEVNEASPIITELPEEEKTITQHCKEKTEPGQVLFKENCHSEEVNICDIALPVVKGKKKKSSKGSRKSSLNSQEPAKLKLLTLKDICEQTVNSMKEKSCSSRVAPAKGQDSTEKSEQTGHKETVDVRIQQDTVEMLLELCDKKMDQIAAKTETERHSPADESSNKTEAKEMNVSLNSLNSSFSTAHVEEDFVQMLENLCDQRIKQLSDEARKEKLEGAVVEFYSSFEANLESTPSEDVHTDATDTAEKSFVNTEEEYIQVLQNLCKEKIEQLTKETLSTNERGANEVDSGTIEEKVIETENSCHNWHHPVYNWLVKNKFSASANNLKAAFSTGKLAQSSNTCLIKDKNFPDSRHRARERQKQEICSETTVKAKICIEDKTNGDKKGKTVGNETDDAQRFIDPIPSLKRAEASAVEKEQSSTTDPSCPEGREEVVVPDSLKLLSSCYPESDVTESEDAPVNVCEGTSTHIVHRNPEKNETASASYTFEGPSVQTTAKLQQLKVESKIESIMSSEAISEYFKCKWSDPNSEGYGKGYFDDRGRETFNDTSSQDDLEFQSPSSERVRKGTQSLVSTDTADSVDDESTETTSLSSCGCNSQVIPPIWNNDNDKESQLHPLPGVRGFELSCLSGKAEGVGLESKSLIDTAVASSSETESGLSDDSQHDSKPVYSQQRDRSASPFTKLRQSVKASEETDLESDSESNTDENEPREKSVSPFTKLRQSIKASEEMVSESGSGSNTDENEPREKSVSPLTKLRQAIKASEESSVIECEPYSKTNNDAERIIQCTGNNNHTSEDTREEVVENSLTFLNSCYPELGDEITDEEPSKSANEHMDVVDADFIEQPKGQRRPKAKEVNELNQSGGDGYIRDVADSKVISEYMKCKWNEDENTSNCELSDIKSEVLNINVAFDEGSDTNSLGLESIDRDKNHLLSGLNEVESVEAKTEDIDQSFDQDGSSSVEYNDRRVVVTSDESSGKHTDRRGVSQRRLSSDELRKRGIVCYSDLDERKTILRKPGRKKKQNMKLLKRAISQDVLAKEKSGMYSQRQDTYCERDDLVDNAGSDPSYNILREKERKHEYRDQWLRQTFGMHNPESLSNPSGRHKNLTKVIPNQPINFETIHSNDLNERNDFVSSSSCYNSPIISPLGNTDIDSLDSLPAGLEAPVTSSSYSSSKTHFTDRKEKLKQPSLTDNAKSDNKPTLNSKNGRRSERSHTGEYDATRLRGTVNVSNEQQSDRSSGKRTYLNRSSSCSSSSSTYSTSDLEAITNTRKARRRFFSGYDSYSPTYSNTDSEPMDVGRDQSTATTSKPPLYKKHQSRWEKYHSNRRYKTNTRGRHCSGSSSTQSSKCRLEHRLQGFTLQNNSSARPQHSRSCERYQGNKPKTRRYSDKRIRHKSDSHTSSNFTDASMKPAKSTVTNGHSANMKQKGKRLYTSESDTSTYSNSTLSSHRRLKQKPKQARLETSYELFSPRFVSRSVRTATNNGTVQNRNICGSGTGNKETATGKSCSKISRDKSLQRSYGSSCLTATSWPVDSRVLGHVEDAASSGLDTDKPKLVHRDLYAVKQKGVFITTILLMQMSIGELESLLLNLETMTTRRCVWKLHILSSQVADLYNIEPEKVVLLTSPHTSHVQLVVDTPGSDVQLQAMILAEQPSVLAVYVLTDESVSGVRLEERVPVQLCSIATFLDQYLSSM